MLNNKTILVAGAGGLLGAKTVCALLENHARVIAADIDVDLMRAKLEQLGHVEGPSLVCMRLNVSDEAGVVGFFDQIQHIDGAINLTYPRNKNYGKHFFDVSLADFNENLGLHLGSSFLFAQQCARYFRQNGHPFSLVTISSIYGVNAPRFEIYENTKMTVPVEYAAIKSAILQLNKYIAAYVSDSNFRINSVSPGGIFDNQPAPFLEAYKKQTLGTGMLQADDIMGAILFLLSDASRYINGQNIIVDDGFSL